jgi:hypothetical protein
LDVIAGTIRLADAQTGRPYRNHLLGLDVVAGTIRLADARMGY